MTYLVEKNRIERIQSYIKLLRKNFECTICIDFFENPLITNCQHAFCKKCIENFIGTKRFQNCPLCKKPINLRSLNKFESLDNFVRHVKTLSDTLEKELESYYNSNQLHNKSDSLTVGHKRKRISNEEENFSKKKKSDAKLQLGFDSINTNFTDENLDKVKKWLETNQNSNLIIQKFGTPENLFNQDAQGKELDTQNKNKSVKNLEQNENQLVQIDKKRPLLTENLNKLNMLKLDNSFNSSSLEIAIISNSDKNDTEKADESSEFKKSFNNNLSKIDNPLKFCGGDAHEQTAQKSRIEINSKSAEKSKEFKNTASKNDSLKNDDVDYVGLESTENDSDQQPEKSFLFEGTITKQDTPSKCFQSLDSGPLQIDDTIYEKNFPLAKEERKPIKFIYFSCKSNKHRTQMQYEIKPLIKIIDVSDKIIQPKITRHVAIQTEIEEKTLEFDEKLEICLIESVYKFIESDAIDQYLVELSYLLATKQIDDTLVLNDDQANQNDANSLCDSTLLLTNESKQLQLMHTKKTSIDSGKFTELIETSKLNISRNRKSMSCRTSKNITPLEFVDDSKNDTLLLVDHNSLSSKKCNVNLSCNLNQNETTTLMESEDTCYNLQMPLTPKNKNKNEFSMESMPEYTIDSRLVIADTPIKEDDQSERVEYLLELNKTLSKSANRMELDKKSIIYFENVSNQSNRFENSYGLEMGKSLLDEDEADFCKNVPIKSNPKEKTSPSLLLNSINTSTSTTEPIFTINSNESIQFRISNDKSIIHANKLPPHAEDILGLSYAGGIDLMSTNNSALYDTETKIRNEKSPEQKEICKTDSVESDKSKKNDKETQLLTDSNLILIDGICNKTNLDDLKNSKTCLDSPNQTTEENKVEEKEEIRYSFVCSLLKPKMKEILKKFADSLKSNVDDDVSDSTTHLIVESDDNLLCGVTSKYLKAISRKIWIVSILWILDSIQKNQISDPELFEIKGDGIFGVHNGPSRARLSSTSIFDDYEFMFVGKFESETINLKELIILSIRSGANIVRKAKDFGESKKRFIIFDEKTLETNKINEMLKSANISVTTASWLLDSLACYQIQDIKDYPANSQTE